MVRDCMVVMQEFGVNAICPGYNARKYEKRRGERIEKPGVKSKKYYTPPSVESDFDRCMQVRDDSPVSSQTHEEERNKNSVKMSAHFEYYQPTPRAKPHTRARHVCISHHASF